MTGVGKYKQEETLIPAVAVSKAQTIDVCVI